MKSPRLSPLIILITLWVPLQSIAQQSVKAVFVSTPPRIDGHVTAGEWKNAAVINQFVQREPDTGQPATEPTTCYISYDKNNIYFGFHCTIDPKDITAKELARDANLSQDDRVQIVLDTFLDHRNGYWFQVGPRGSYGDALVSQNGAAFNKQWDGLWVGKASINAQGWDAELAIPFKTLSFRAGQTTWGLKLIRHIKKKLEATYWPSVNLDSYRFQVSDCGLLTGLDGISQGIGLDISPYGLAGVNQKINEKNAFPTDAGVDVFYQVSPGLKSALTVNTDFAQTEVDSRQINLTRFQLHFPEKRDFFLDGANYFQFGLDGDRANPYSKRLIPFFSRRMGLDNGGNPIPIVWGGKMTGQVGNWNLGFINIMDDRQSGKQNFTVARVTRNLGNQSSVGFIGTMGNALADGSNSVVGADLKLATSTFRGKQNLALLLFGLKSNTEGLTKKNRAFGGEVVYPNDFFMMRAGFHQIEKNFRAGVGFVPRQNIRETYFESSLGPRPNRWKILQVFFKANLDYITDMNNRLLTRQIQFTPLSIRFISGDEISLTSGPQYELLIKDFKIHPEHTISTGIYDFWRHSILITGAKRRNFWASVNYNWGSFYNGERQNIVLASGYKITVPLLVGLEFEDNNISLPDGAFSTNVYRINANILFSPNMTLYNFIQYDNLTKVMGWQTRFVWILKPGNEILLSWNSRWNDPLERYQVTESAARLKVKYNYRF
ncbi:MAG: carbohydrate binding family 9 domain-containing protein [Calditrichaeota bacterium]|nr:carbohydrate binding family 9 domain-containing protein [Calditrichota bacterium]